MHTPTRRQPTIQLQAGPLRLIRGYEVVSTDGKIQFLGAHDGPLVKLQGPDVQMIFRLAFLPELIEGLQALAAPMAAAPGEHDAEIRAMGFTPVE